MLRATNANKMRLFGLFLSCFLTQTCLAQFKLAKLDTKSLPGSIPYNGKVVQAIRWTDNTGDNIVLLTRTDEVQSKDALEEDYSNAALYAYRYLVSGDSVKQAWRVYEYVKECPVDIFLYFVDKTFAVTDLNKDGKAEVWLMYKHSCQGDVSPIPMKIIMYEDNKKFAARGTTRVQVSEKEYSGGEFTFDDTFKKGPAAFRVYAEKLWKQHKVEKWEQ
jgi:hypothetical protein